MKIDPSHHVGDTDDTRSGSTPSLRVWGRIVSELAHLQDAASPQSPGSVVNPVCGASYIVDTCCAAVVFAAEYRRTDDYGWRTRAEAAIAATRSGLPSRGISEPTWDVLGWHDVPESLPATGMAVDAYCAALNQLGLALDEDPVWDPLDLLLSCRLRNGGFGHNAPIPGQELAEVQNATASALNLLGRLAREKNPESHPAYTGLEATLLRLGRGQIASGFWPYHYPGRRLRLRDALDRWPFKTFLGPDRFLAYHGHGDITHHLMTLYFATGYLSSSGARAEIGMLASGWGWITKRLVRAGDRSLSIDWALDPTARSPRFSNARDTNAYFLMLGAIPRLTSLGIIEKSESGAIVRALLAHIDSKLMSEPDRTPCITPLEGPPELVRNILPMFEQSVAWKGRLMADIILAEDAIARDSLL